MIYFSQLMNGAYCVTRHQIDDIPLVQYIGMLEQPPNGIEYRLSIASKNSRDIVLDALELRTIIAFIETLTARKIA